MRSLLLLSSCLALVVAGDLRYSQTVGKDGTISLQWDFDTESETITLQIQCKCKGWVALGFSPSGGMKGADIVIVGKYLNKTVYFADYHAPEYSRPVKDDLQNYQLLSVTEDETTTTARFSRKFRTCDNNDVDITKDTMSMIFAHGGADDNLKYHGSNCFQENIILLNEEGNTYSPEPTTSSYFDVLMNDYPVPSDVTTYGCQFLGPFQFSQKYHIYKVEALIQPGNENLVHHMIVYSCPNNTQIVKESGICYSKDPKYAAYYQCVQLMSGWAVGGGDLVLPPEAGISIGDLNDPTYLKIEIHYNNMKKLSEIRDNSGFRLHYTSELRMYDSGIIQTGYFLFHLNMFIPPGVEYFETNGLCKTKKFQELNPGPVTDMQVFDFFPHTHLSGKTVEAALFRDGKQMSSLGQDLHFDFNLQRIRPINVTVKMGDDIRTKCTYNTLSATKLVPGGLSTEEEMCLVFFFYYPKNSIATCESEANQTYVAEQLGVDPSLPLTISLANYSWDADSIMTAQVATKQSVQTVIIGNELGEKVVDFGVNQEITQPERGVCSATTYTIPG
ncbi:putative DBH-like monooxygenase protein 2 [Microcaecilia unicolor]|uniref:DBH-like monooxygenase protein 2 n=1 Tax=Microcaecilia unicolor TaxID=1415580 RepID=A0A6P7WTW9_9AMPH|nr:putative DBH-like monooxygenase protein 2 [Microcaecilia unicolor]